MFERFTDRARRVLVLAQEESRLLNHNFIGTEHLLLGLISEGHGVAAKALEQLGIELEDVRDRVEETIGLTGTLSTGSPPFTPRAKKVLELALREALQLGHNYIGTEHIILGIVQEGEGVGAQVLTDLGSDPTTVRQKVVELLSGYPLSSDPAPNSTPLRRRVPQTSSILGPSSQGRFVACSFCGRRPPATGQLVSGNDAFICEHCVRKWALQVGQSITPTQPARTAHIYRPVEPSGPPPEDEDAARAEIAAAFVEHGTVSDDGQALPFVEGGENLGPLPRRARENRKGIVPDDVEIAITVDEIAFLDAEHAAVWFSISVDGRTLLDRHQGDALVADGHWKMARSTLCGLMALAGVECPPSEHRHGEG